jgi:PAS domain S-box-containing protein
MKKDTTRARARVGARRGVPHVMVTHCSMKANAPVDEAMREQARRIARVFDSMAQLVGVVNARGRLEYCNANWREVFGTSAGEDAEPAIVDKLHPEDRERWLATWHEALARGTAYQIEHRVRTPRSTEYIWYRECAAPVHESSGRVECWVITATWIDDQKRKEGELRSLLNRKAEFFATLLHELRNPLAPIANALELLGRHSADAQIVIRSRGIIQRQLRQLSRLVDDLVDVSRLERGNYELQRVTVDVADVVATAVETARPLIEMRQHHLATSIPRTIFLLEADPIRLGQVLTNLLINAAKYTEPGGYISVRAEQTETDVRVHVRDSGAGIAREQLAHVFQLFAQSGTTSSLRMGGLGVGLAVARQLMELHGGSISAQSEGLGRGSEFTISLPRMDDTAPRGA